MKPGILIVPVMLSAILGGCLNDSSSGQEPTSAPTESEAVATATRTAPVEIVVTPHPLPFADRTPEVIEDCDPTQPIGGGADTEYFPPEPPEVIAAHADLVITARVVEILPPRWTTEGNIRPNPCAKTEPFQRRDEIVTPVVVEFDGELIGGDWELLRMLWIEKIDQGERLVVMVAGGQIGEDQFDNDYQGHVLYEVNQQVVLVLRMFRAGAYVEFGGWGHAVPWHLVKGAPWIPSMKWTVQPDGSAVADYGGSDPAELPLDDLLDRLRPAVPVFPTVIPD